ncbi:MAG: protocatechuate 3,4-dioxygenase [Gammaproteobacteria bacterium]|nr:protocatechuate 3,4-dioxygenase [Gammaproteobacteria bacterium]
MARILGGIYTSHIPAIGAAIAKGRQGEPYWKPFFDGYPPVREWLDAVRPDAAVIVYNDHGLNFFLDKMPTFAIGAAPEYRNADEGWGLPTLGPYAGCPELSWHLAESLVADEFDMTTCQEMLVDHAFTVPMSLLWPEPERRPPVVPISVNTVQHPLPTPARCFALGRAVGRGIASWPEDIGVVVIATGGLSHQLDGRRAGFINREFDLLCLDRIATEPEALTRYTIRDLVRLAGSQGVELIMWLVARGALGGHVSKVHSHYHVPVSNTAAGVLVLDNEAA